MEKRRRAGKIGTEEYNEYLSDFFSDAEEEQQETKIILDAICPSVRPIAVRGQSGEYDPVDEGFKALNAAVYATAILDYLDIVQRVLEVSRSSTDRMLIRLCDQMNEIVRQIFEMDGGYEMLEAVNRLIQLPHRFPPEDGYKVAELIRRIKQKKGMIRRVL